MLAVLDEERGLKMGQAITKCIHPAAAEDNPLGIDPAHLKPRGLYPNQSAYFKQAKVKKLILQGNIAPCFPASDEDPEMEVRTYFRRKCLSRCPGPCRRAGSSLRHVALAFAVDFCSFVGRAFSQKDAG